MATILIVEDTLSLREVLCTLLTKEGYKTIPCGSATEAMQQLAQNEVDCILSDFKLPGDNGLTFLGLVREIKPATPFILMTAYASINMAVEALKLGANDFLCKPFEPQHLLSVLTQVLSNKQVLDRPQSSGLRREHPIIGNSAAMREVLAQANKVAPYDSPVLITGESGTGKELLARLIHAQSPRKHGPFLAINCGAIPEALLESELFGHEAGSFTGATQRRIGLIEAAHLGTLFLDEVGDMPLTLQVKLLRVLQEREVRRIGATDAIAAAPRIVSATNKDLFLAMQEREFREDLYYRIAVIPLHIPALRERVDDLKPLTEYFTQYHSAKLGVEAPAITPDCWIALSRHNWSGNIRELENRVERAIVLGEKVITPESLGLSLGLEFSSLNSATQTLSDIAQHAVADAERAAIVRALAIHKGNKAQAARALGVSYKTILNKVRLYGLGDSNEAEPSKEL